LILELAGFDEAVDLLTRVLVVILLMALVKCDELLRAVHHGLNIDVALG